MSPAHLHLALAHVPIAGIFFGLIVLGLALARSNHEMFRASLLLFSLVGVVSLVVYLLGEPAEEIVEELAGITHDLIHEHEEIALFAMISGVALGIVSAVGLWLSRVARPRGLAAVVLVLALLTAGIMAVTANRGGQINHPEIRSGEGPAPGSSHDRNDH